MGARFGRGQLAVGKHRSVDKAPTAGSDLGAPRICPVSGMGTQVVHLVGTVSAHLRFLGYCSPGDRGVVR
jgi:hypothetical protein